MKFLFLIRSSMDWWSRSCDSSIPLAPCSSRELTDVISYCCKGSNQNFIPRVLYMQRTREIFRVITCWTPIGRTKWTYGRLFQSISMPLAHPWPVSPILSILSSLWSKIEAWPYITTAVGSGRDMCIVVSLSGFIAPWWVQNENSSTFLQVVTN